MSTNRKTNFKTEILAYLQERHGKDVSRQLLCKRFKISSSRLSEVISSIRADGYNLITPPRKGMVRFEPEQDQLILSDIKDSDIRKWLIVYVLSVYGSLTFVEILIKIMIIYDNNLDQLESLAKSNAYDNAAIIRTIREDAAIILGYSPDQVSKDCISVTAFRKDLTELRDQGIVEVTHAKRTEYKLSQKAPTVTPIDTDNLYIFCKHYETTPTFSDNEVAEKIYNKICLLINYENESAKQEVFGRIDSCSDDERNSFFEYINHQYDSKLIEFDYCCNGITEHVVFETGLLFYRKDISRFFTLGKDTTNNKIRSLKLVNIKNIKTLNKNNRIFHSEEYKRIYQQMFSSTYEEGIYDVEVLVMDYYSEYIYFSELKDIREASFEEIDHNLTDGYVYSEKDKDSKNKDFKYKYIYRDKIRGLNDFAEFLSAFGFAAIAIQPPELREIMIKKYNNIATNTEAPI